MADKDKNGVLDSDEIQGLHQKFPKNKGIKNLLSKLCNKQYNGRNLKNIGFSKIEATESFNRFYTTLKKFGNQ